MKKILLTTILLFLFTLQSCTTRRQMLYVQDLDKYANSSITYVNTAIQPNDILKVDIIDLNPAVAAPFNINMNLGQENSIDIMKLKGYIVTPLGNITMPILNEINVKNLTPSDLERKIKERLVNEGYLVNPTVIVRVLNNKFTIIGEVNSPGVKPFTEESISLLEAIGKAGDLTYSGIRRDVVLIREIEGQRKIYHLDLTKASWLTDPTYRIRQNDIIIVKPNKLKANSGGVIKDPLQVLSLAASLLAVFLLVK